MYARRSITLKLGLGNSGPDDTYRLQYEKRELLFRISEQILTISTNRMANIVHKDSIFGCVRNTNQCIGRMVLASVIETTTSLDFARMIKNYDMKGIRRHMLARTCRQWMFTKSAVFCGKWMKKGWDRNSDRIYISIFRNSVERSGRDGKSRFEVVSAAVIFRISRRRLSIAT